MHLTIAARAMGVEPHTRVVLLPEFADESWTSDTGCRVEPLTYRPKTLNPKRLQIPNPLTPNPLTHASLLEAPRTVNITCSGAAEAATIRSQSRASLSKECSAPVSCHSCRRPLFGTLRTLRAGWQLGFRLGPYHCGIPPAW